jgi:hypothetical protein
MGGELVFLRRTSVPDEKKLHLLIRITAVPAENPAL